MAENPDHFTYGGVMFYRETLEFFLAAARFYESLLQRDIDAVLSDPDLGLFFKRDDVERFSVFEELSRVKRMHTWLDTKVSESTGFGAHMSISHGSVRYIKSVCHLYMQHLEARRCELATKPNLSHHALAAVDSKLSALRDKTAGGVFKDATPIPLLVDDLTPPELISQIIVDEQPPKAVRTPRPVLIESIQILDSAIRGRCMDLFSQFTETGQHERLDTVVSEATRILEDRIRACSGAPPTVTGVELASFAFSGANPRITLSAIGAEQEAAHLLFRGVFGFVRNRVHHHLVADIAPDRALQIVAIIDYLLSLVDGVSMNPASA